MIERAFTKVELTALAYALHFGREFDIDQVRALGLYDEYERLRDQECEWLLRQRELVVTS